MITRLLVLALAAMAVACGGGGDDVLYDRAVTESCLRDKGYSPEPIDDTALAPRGGPAANGAIEIKTEFGWVEIAFENDADDAERRADILRPRFLEASNYDDDYDDYVRRKGNVTYYATSITPQRDALDDVKACLTD